MSTEPPAEEKPRPQSSTDKIRAALAEKLAEAEEAASQSTLSRERADTTDDLEEKALLQEEAAKQDKKAKAANKAADRLQSGVWQGSAGGAGIGASVGAGVGAVVGTLVGGVAAIPTTGLGLLVGVGAGAVHGPWVTRAGKSDGEEDEVETLEEDEKPVPSSDKS
jgi:hypothetical protein